jgi:hypothetical protein
MGYNEEVDCNTYDRDQINNSGDDDGNEGQNMERAQAKANHFDDDHDDGDDDEWGSQS